MDAVVDKPSSTFYSIIRSNNVESLNDWFKTSKMTPETVFQLLGGAYEELHLKNVPISPEMQFEVEWRLADLQFLTNNYTEPAEDFKTFKCIKQHLDLTCDIIKSFLSKYSANRETYAKSLSFINDAKLVTLHISVLKRRLDFTYKKIPWEEMEFCMVLLVLTLTQSREIELSYELILDSERVLRQLRYFFKQLLEVQHSFSKEDTNNLGSDSERLKGILNEFRMLISTSEGHQIKGRLGCKQAILTNSHGFADLYKDFSLLRDIYSLSRMKHYLTIALAIDVEVQPTIGYLVIQRALQVIGEYLKNEKESPNISESLYQVLIKLIATNLKMTCASLRNMLSHSHTLIKRLELEANNDKNIFKNIQTDLKTINAEIIRVLYKRKIDALKVCLENVKQCTKLEEARKILQHVISINKLDEFKPIELPSLSHVKDLIVTFWHQVKDDINDDGSLDEIMELVNGYEASLKRIASGYSKGIKVVYQMSKSSEGEQLNRTQTVASSYLCMLNSLDLKGVFEQNIFSSLHIIYKKFKLTRCGDVNDILSTDQKLMEVSRILTRIHDILKWDLQSIKWLEELNSELKNYEKANTVNGEERAEDLFEKVKNQMDVEEGNTFWGSVIKAKQRCSVKAKLLDFRAQSPEEFKATLTSINLDREAEKVILNSYTKKNYKELEKRIKGRIADPYQFLINKLEGLGDILPLDTHLSYLKKFYSSLDLNKAIINKAYKLSTDRTLQEIRIDYCQRLSTLKEVLSSTDNIKTINDAGTVTALEMLVLDLTEYIAKTGSLGDSKTFLIGKLSILNGKQLRNHLAHGSIITHILPYNSNVPLLVYAQRLLDLDDTIITQKGTWTVGFNFLIIGNNDMCSYITSCQTVVKLQDDLFRAVEEGRFDDSLLLIKAGADVYAKDAKGWSVLDLAVKNNNKIFTNYLIANNFIKEDNLFGFISPCVALSSYETFTFFLENANLNINFICNENHSTLLHIAAELGQLKITQFLLENITHSPAVTTVLAETPLHLACKNGYLDVAILLLNNSHYGNDDGFINKQTNSGETALHLAAENGHCNVAAELIRRNADVSLLRSDSLTAFELAIRNGHKPVFDILLLKQHSLEEKIKALKLAAQYGRCNIVSTLLMETDIINEKINDAAYMAVMFGHVDVLVILLKCGVNIEWKHNNGNSLLHLASQFGHVEAVKILLEYDAEVNARNEGGWTSLHFAFQNSNLDVISLLISNKADVNPYDISGMTPFHVAAECGALGSVNLFLQIFPDSINMRTKTAESSALHLASGPGHKEVVRLLVQLGADVNLQAANKSTPLHWAIQRHGYDEVVAILIQGKANLNLQDDLGATPLHTAVINQNTAIVEALLQHNVNVKIANNMFFTPLHVAAMHQNFNIVRLLLTKMDEVDIRSHKSQTPLHKAARHGCKEIVRLLLQKGADCNLVSVNNISALHFAASYGHFSIVNLLLEHGGKINEYDNNGRTPLFMAIIRGHKDIAKLLIKYGAGVKEQVDESASTSGGHKSSIHDMLVDAFTKKYVEELTAEDIAANNGVNEDIA